MLLCLFLIQQIFNIHLDPDIGGLLFVKIVRIDPLRLLYIVKPTIGSYGRHPKFVFEPDTRIIFPFLIRPSFPSETEQYLVYR